MWCMQFITVCKCWVVSTVTITLWNWQSNIHIHTMLGCYKRGERSCAFLSNSLFSIFDTSISITHVHVNNQCNVVNVFWEWLSQNRQRYTYMQLVHICITVVFPWCFLSPKTLYNALHRYQHLWFPCSRLAQSRVVGCFMSPTNLLNVDPYLKELGCLALPSTGLNQA